MAKSHSNPNGSLFHMDVDGIIISNFYFNVGCPFSLIVPWQASTSLGGFPTKGCISWISILDPNAWSRAVLTLELFMFWFWDTLAYIYFGLPRWSDLFYNWSGSNILTILPLIIDVWYLIIYHADRKKAVFLAYLAIRLTYFFCGFFSAVPTLGHIHQLVWILICFTSFWRNSL